MSEIRSGISLLCTFPGEVSHIHGLRQFRGRTYAATNSGVWEIVGNTVRRLRLDSSYDGPPVMANPQTGEFGCWLDTPQPGQDND